MHDATLLHRHLTGNGSRTCQRSILIHGDSTGTRVGSVDGERTTIDGSRALIVVLSCQAPYAGTRLHNADRTCMSASADRPVVDDTTEGFVGIGTTHGPGAGKVVRLLAGAIQIGARRSGETANSHVAIGAPIAQASIALELNDCLIHLGSLVKQQQRTTLVGRDAIGHETAREATPVALNIFAQVWDVELQRAVARHLIIYIAAPIGIFL